jgi:hypothetical protein
MRLHIFFISMILSYRLDVVMTTTSHGPSTASIDGSESIPMMAGYQPMYFVPEFVSAQIIKDIIIFIH